MADDGKALEAALDVVRTWCESIEARLRDVRARLDGGNDALGAEVESVAALVRHRFDAEEVLRADVASGPTPEKAEAVAQLVEAADRDRLSVENRVSLLEAAVTQAGKGAGRGVSPLLVLLAAMVALAVGFGIAFLAFGGADGSSEPQVATSSDEEAQTDDGSTTTTAAAPSSTTVAAGASTTAVTSAPTPGSTPTAYVATVDCAGVRDLLQTGTNPAMREALTYDRAKARIRLIATGNGPSPGSRVDTKDIKLELFGEWDGVTYLVTYQVGSLRGPDKWGINGDGKEQPAGTFDAVESGTGTSFLLQGSTCSPLA